MTYAFLVETGFDIHEDVISAKMYHEIDVLESGMDALREGVDDIYVDKVTYSYARTLIQDVLSNVRNYLLEMVQKLLSLINNVYTNSIKLLDKYQDILLARLEKLDKPVIHVTNAYPPCDSYPVIIRAGSIEKEVNALMKAVSNGTITPGKVAMQVDTMIRNFGQITTKEVIDPMNLTESVTKAVTKHVKGKPKTMSVNADTIKDYIKTIKRYREDVAEVQALKKDIMEEYLALRDTHVRATENTTVVMKNTVRYQVAPDKEEFMAQEYNRFADINADIMRLFNGYVAIYRTAFDTKLKCLFDRYNDRKDFITKLFTATGIFAAVNTANSPNRVEIKTRIDQGKKKK